MGFYRFQFIDKTNIFLAKLENSIGIKGFGYYTKEALENLYAIWVDNLTSLAKGKPQNRVT